MLLLPRASVPFCASVPTVLLAPIDNVPAASICAVPVVPVNPAFALIAPFIGWTVPSLVNGTTTFNAAPLLA
jgi:hypothetical protein